MVVPGVTAKRGPYLGLLISADVEQAIPGRRQQPFMRAGVVGITADVLEVDLDLAYRLRSVNSRHTMMLMRELSQAFRRHHDRTGGNNVRENQRAGARRDGIRKQLNQMVRIVGGNRNWNLLHHDPIALGPLLPSADTPRVLAVGQDDLVTGLKVDTVGD